MLKILKRKKIFLILLVSIFIVLQLSLVICAQEPQKITLTAGTIGGSTNLVVNSLAYILRNYCNVQPTVTVTPTMASVDALQKKESDIGTPTGYLTYEAYYGLGEYENEPFEEIRSVMERPSMEIQIAVLKDSPIENVMDLRGKRVSVGKEGFSAEYIAKKMFEALDLTYDDFSPLFLGHQDSLAGIVSGKIDAMLVGGSVPHTGITELAETSRHGIRIIDFSNEEMETIQSKVPYIQPSIMLMPYKGMGEEEITIPVHRSPIGCRKDLSEEIVYCLVKNFWENQEEAANQYSAMGDLKLEAISSMGGMAPWHIGAYRYYKEVGLEIDEEMIPPEANKE